MAHGYAMVSGKVPAVMVHVNVGTANAICGALNAARENVPILVTAGRTPLTEEGLPGARDAYIHWGQEMYDQAGMLREPSNGITSCATASSSRRSSIARSAIAPQRAGGTGLSDLAARGPGPIDAAASSRYEQPGRRVAAAAARANASALAEAARILAKAESPLIITTNAGRDPDVMAGARRLR